MKFCFVFVSKNAICHSGHRHVLDQSEDGFLFSLRNAFFLPKLKSALVLSRTRHTITDGIIIEQRVM